MSINKINRLNTMFFVIALSAFNLNMAMEKEVNSLLDMPNEMKMHILEQNIKTIIDDNTIIDALNKVNGFISNANSMNKK